VGTCHCCTPCLQLKAMRERERERGKRNLDVLKI
jgi:hypothetical protein